MQHEPVGDDDHCCKDAEFSDRSEVDTQPDHKEQDEVGERGEGDGGADFI